MSGEAMKEKQNGLDEFQSDPYVSIEANRPIRLLFSSLTGW
jgi:hypothetical protein